MDRVRSSSSGSVNVNPSPISLRTLALAWQSSVKISGPRSNRHMYCCLSGHKNLSDSPRYTIRRQTTALLSAARRLLSSRTTTWSPSPERWYIQILSYQTPSQALMALRSSSLSEASKAVNSCSEHISDSSNVRLSRRDPHVSFRIRSEPLAGRGQPGGDS